MTDRQLCDSWFITVGRGVRAQWLAVSDNPFRPGAPDTLTVWSLYPEAPAHDVRRVELAKKIVAAGSFSIEPPTTEGDDEKNSRALIYGIVP